MSSTLRSSWAPPGGSTQPPQPRRYTQAPPPASPTAAAPVRRQHRQRPPACVRTPATAKPASMPPRWAQESTRGNARPETTEMTSEIKMACRPHQVLALPEPAPIHAFSVAGQPSSPAPPAAPAAMRPCRAPEAPTESCAGSESTALRRLPPRPLSKYNAAVHQAPQCASTDAPIHHCTSMLGRRWNTPACKKMHVNNRQYWPSWR
mmetsp:Transcript_17157/g.47269  ORF Transcript_17157/g.47269 Transcript_17157/m.47269 type:complete len:206 (+) Transcript_17157:185-802(+)